MLFATRSAGSSAGQATPPEPKLSWATVSRSRRHGSIWTPIPASFGTDFQQPYFSDWQLAGLPGVRADQNHAGAALFVTTAVMRTTQS